MCPGIRLASVGRYDYPSPNPLRSETPGRGGEGIFSRYTPPGSGPEYAFPLYLITDSKLVRRIAYDNL